jgi:Flp pilus assembly protein TadG
MGSLNGRGGKRSSVAGICRLLSARNDDGSLLEFAFHVPMTIIQRQIRTLKRRLDRATRLTQSQVERWPLVRCGALLKGESQGNAIIEIALALPMLLALLTGICAFGMAFGNELTLTSAVGAGGQYLQLIRSSTTDPCQDTLTAIENAAPALTQGNIQLSFSFNGTSVTGNSCSGDQKYLAQGEPVTVTATYPCALPIYGTRFSAGCQLSAKVTEYEY